MELFLKIAGVIIATAGFILCLNPELVSKKPIPEDIFTAIERRVWWGLLIGFGILLLFHHQITSVFISMAAAGIAFTLGIISARLIGIVLDGSNAKQWLWIAIELIILIPFVMWYCWQKDML